MPLLLVIPALPRTADAAHDALPRLPALCELLRLSDAGGTSQAWRSGLMGDLGASTAVPEAVIAASALGIGAGSAVCLAAPVHAVAGLHRVHMHAAGILTLPADEQAVLAEGFAAQFGTELRLHAAGNQWLLEAPCAISARDTDPAEWAGAPLERQPANSPEQRVLRRLGAELEMWLADLPLNARRRSRGQLPVNLIWMWGGGAMPAADQLPVLPVARVHGPLDDAWLAGCAHLARSTVLPLPACWQHMGESRNVLVLPAPADGVQLLKLESDWFGPALEDLGAGRIDGFDLRLGRQLHRVRHGRIRRLLRRSKPWWQGSSA